MVNLRSETYLLNLPQALLTEHPDLFLGATRAAALRRVPVSSIGGTSVMRIATGRLIHKLSWH